MINSILFTGLLVFVAVFTPLSAKEFDLRANMVKLDSELNNLQRGFMTSNKKAVDVALERFAIDADKLFNNREQMIDMLPKDIKEKKHKANIAFDSSRIMKNSIETIRKAVSNKGKSIKKRQKIAQEAYLEIVDACFRCHNLVRDKGRIIE